MAFLCLLSLGQNNSPSSQDPQKDLGSLQLADFLGSSSTEVGAFLVLGIRLMGARLVLAGVK